MNLKSNELKKFTSVSDFVGDKKIIVGAFELLTF
jgi:hypothetical protein